MFFFGMRSVLAYEELAQPQYGVIFNGLLLSLQGIHVYWFVLIVRTAIRIVQRGRFERDIRSEDEEEEEEEKKKESVVFTKKLETETELVSESHTSQHFRYRRHRFSNNNNIINHSSNNEKRTE
jgi:cell division protein FtsL